VCIDLLEYSNDGTIKPIVQTTTGVSAVPVIVPTGVAIDTAGNLYVSDSADGTIQKISPAGIAGVHAGSSGVQGSADGTGAAASFRSPQGLAAAGDGTVYVADTGNSTIRKISPAGVVSTLAGSPSASGNTDGTGASARFSKPADVSTAPNGVVYVADTGNHWIRRIDASGVVTTLPSTSLGFEGDPIPGRPAPEGVALSNSGDLYVANTAGNTLLALDAATGVVSVLAGTDGVTGSTDGTKSNALFSGPTGTTVDSTGNIYVVDTQNSTIRKISAAGTVTTLAGLPGIAGFKDGPGNTAWFNKPRDITIDSTGNLYVADTGNAVIRKITPAGAVSTLAITIATTPGGSNPGTPGGGSPPPTVPAPATPNNSGSGGGGGGGAPSAAYLAALLAIVLVRGVHLSFSPRKPN
jgi:sugar lactone lactonase YvrE